MPIWSGILNELASSQKGNRPPDFDGVRRKYLLGLQGYSRRNVILYATAWLQRPEAPSNDLSITDEDMQGFMEVCNGLKGDELDLILHSPGGSAEAAEAIVSYLRSRFSNIRVIVPQLAMSAATMIACASDTIAMGQHSFLGPTDPQVMLPTPLGVRSAPAQSILDQFDKAQKDCADPAKLSAWLPMLSQYGPDLLVQCETAIDMSQELVKTWLENFMFKSESDRASKAKRISAWLADHKRFKSHGRHVPRGDLEAQGLTIQRLEEDHQFQDLSLSVFHATTHTFSGTEALKIVENHTGRAFIKSQISRNPAPPNQPA